MKASTTWLASTGADFSAGAGRSGYAHLSHYSVNYREWGDGPPLVLVPGLAGGYELLGPLARLLALPDYERLQAADLLDWRAVRCHDDVA